MTGNKYCATIYFNTTRDERLAGKLKTVLTSDDPRLLVCVWDYFGSLNEYTEWVGGVARATMPEMRDEINDLLDFSKIYGNACVSRCYMTLKNKELAKGYFYKWKCLWSNREIYIVEGSGSRLGVGNDLFNAAANIRRIICPAENAYLKYDDILDFITSNVSKERLILIALGVTATALAYDLSQRGFWAIDIGHLDIEYEWYLQGRESVAPVKFKYTNDASKNRFEDLGDEEYEHEIIKKIL